MRAPNGEHACYITISQSTDYKIIKPKGIYLLVY